MAQLKQTVSVTNGSQAVSLAGDYTAQIKKNFTFMVASELVPYTVAADSTFDTISGNTNFTLTGSYQGTTNAAAAGVVVVDVTYPDLLPTIRQGDVGTAAIFTDAMYKLQALITNVSPSGLQVIQDLHDETLAAEAAASISETNAKTSETNSKTSETNSKTSENNAFASQALAQKWATQMSAEVVVGQGYGAQKYANDAAASAGAANTSATNANTSMLASQAARDIAKAQIASLQFTFDSATADADPTTGKFRLNNATLSAATIAYVSTTDANAAAVAAILDFLDDSTNPTTKAVLMMKEGATGKVAYYKITSAIVVATNYRKINLTWLAGSTGGFTAANLVGVGFSVVADQPAGALFAANNLSDLANISTARTNLGLGNVTNTSDANKPVSTAQQTALNGKVDKTSGTGAAQVPAGTTAQRDAAPAAGYFRFNSTLNQFEGHNGAAWGAVGGGATGAAGNNVFVENDQVVTGDYTITAGKNAMSAGPVTINTGVTVTVPTGSVWSIV